MNDKKFAELDSRLCSIEAELVTLDKKLDDLLQSSQEKVPSDPNEKEQSSMKESTSIEEPTLSLNSIRTPIPMRIQQRAVTISTAT